MEGLIKSATVCIKIVVILENLNDLKDFIELKDLRPQGLGPIEITYVLFDFPYHIWPTLL